MKASQEKQDKTKQASTPSTQVPSTGDDSSGSRLLGLPGPGDILPPNAETTAAPDTSSDESAKADSLALFSAKPSAEPLKEGENPSKESKRALSVAELIALTDLINDSAVRMLS